jgi:hypothetical protein
MPINTLINYGSFAILSILWLAFAAALIFNQAILDSIWQSFRAFPLIVQLGIGLLLLPVVAGLWIWQTPWPLWLRLILVVGLGIATVYTFFPKQA